MKNSKIKMLTATACLALVGTASAAWVYAGTATESANIGVKVASYASAGTIEVTGNDNYYLYLDYGSVTWEQKETGTNLVATHTVDSALDQTGKTAKLTYTVTLKGYLAEIVKFSDTSLNNDIAADDSGYAARTSKDIEWTSGSAITLPSLEWVTNTEEGDYKNQTYDKAYVVEENYKKLIYWLKGAELDSTWNQNEDIDVGELVEITFNATVISN